MEGWETLASPVSEALCFERKIVSFELLSQQMSLRVCSRMLSPMLCQSVRQAWAGLPGASPDEQCHPLSLREWLYSVVDRAV